MLVLTVQTLKDNFLFDFSPEKCSSILQDKLYYKHKHINPLTWQSIFVIKDQQKIDNLEKSTIC